MFMYVGAKQRLAPTYPPPKHDLIIEPFAGAAHYSVYWLQRNPDLRAVATDIDPTLVKLWTRLLELGAEGVWNYPAPVKGDETDDVVYLIGSVSAGSWGRYKREQLFQVTGWQARDFDTQRKKVAHALARIEGRITVELAEYDSHPDVEATWFIDPPYQREGGSYNSGNDLDFVALGDWCRSRRGQTIVCETVGADWMEFKPHVTNRTVSHLGNTSIEAIWLNEPEPTLFDQVASGHGM